MFYKIGVPKDFAKFMGKHLSWSQFLINLQAFTEKPIAAASGRRQMCQERWHEQLGSICSGTWIFTRHCLYWKNASFYPAAIILQEMLSNIRTPPSLSSISHQEHLFYGTPTSGCFRTERKYANICLLSNSPKPKFREIQKNLFCKNETPDKSKTSCKRFSVKLLEVNNFP